jgi:alpha-beta hydrolase superfamily lysophospholipase
MELDWTITLVFRPNVTGANAVPRQCRLTTCRAAARARIAHAARAETARALTLHPHGANMPTPTTPRAAGRVPDTIVLVHGFWVTPRSWEHWITHYEAKGYRVLAPAYPGFEVEVEALNADPTPIERLTVPAIIAHLESIVEALDAPPILVGHSAGGTFVQILLDHGFGAAGVVTNSAPTEGVLVAPWSQIRATFPVLKSPANRHKAVGLTYEQWRYTFTNTFPEAEARALYERYHVPASGGILWDSVLANFEPGRQETWVDYRNAARAPLLFISGGSDHLMPPVVQHSNAAHYTPETLTEVTVFEGRSHLLPAQRGWEDVADYALAWAERHAVARPAVARNAASNALPEAAPGAALHA